MTNKWNPSSPFNFRTLSLTPSTPPSIPSSLTIKNYEKRILSTWGSSRYNKWIFVIIMLRNES